MTVPADEITVLVSTSPIPVHPSTAILDETLNSIRERLPDQRILVLADGVRDEQADRADAYADYLTAVKADIACGRWGDAEVIGWADHQHQARMFRHALANLDTPLVFAAEHDTPICEEIPFDAFCDVIHSGALHVIRLNHEAHVLEPHQWLALDRGPRVIGGLPFVRTAQFSARPHLADADYYRWLLGPEHFNPDTRTYVEDVAHGVIVSAWRDYGVGGWQQHRIGIYAPDGDQKRSLHTDGRGDDPKYQLRILPLEGDS